MALIGDVHANLPALEAVLEHAHQNGVEAIWNVGDFVGYGAFPDQVVKRLSGQPGTRPLLAGPDPERRAAEMLAERRPMYEAAADIRIETSGRPPDDVVDRIVRALEDWHASANI